MGAFNILVMLLALGLPSLWAPGPAANKKGNEAFRKGDYDKAAGAYARALDALPADKRLVFNRGTALLGQKKGDEALSALVSATADPRPDVQSAAFYNAGNALFDGQKLDEALDAYKRAILANPNDENAKFNYELAGRRKAEKDQQDQKKDPDKKNDQKSDQNKQQQQQQQDEQEKKDQQQNPDQPPKPQPDQEDQPQPPKPQPAAQMSKEQAERLLDALKANEKEMIKARMTSRRKRDVDKDW